MTESVLSESPCLEITNIEKEKSLVATVNDKESGLEEINLLINEETNNDTNNIDGIVKLHDVDEIHDDCSKLSVNIENCSVCKDKSCKCMDYSSISSDNDTFTKSGILNSENKDQRVIMIQNEFEIRSDQGDEFLAKDITISNSSEENLSSDVSSHFCEIDSPMSPSFQEDVGNKSLFSELSALREQISVLQADVKRLESDKDRLEAEVSHDLCSVQLESLEKTVAQQHREIERLCEDIRQQEELYNNKRKELEFRLEKALKQCESEKKDKESMVVKYAVSEKEVITQKKDNETFVKKIKDHGKEKDSMQIKIKNLTTDKVMISKMLDVKCQELLSMQKKNESLKEDLNSSDIKIKWAQNKLKSEADLHKETKSELEIVKKAFKDLQLSYDELKRSESKPESNSSESDEPDNEETIFQNKTADELYSSPGNEIDNLKKKYQSIIEENNQLSIKVQNLEKERLDSEQKLSKLKVLLDAKNQEAVVLQTSLADMESMKTQIQQVQEKLVTSQSEVERLRESNLELQQEMEGCREREAELLDFTQKLTDKNVRLQSEFSFTEAKAQELEETNNALQSQITSLEAKLSTLNQQLAEEKHLRKEEGKLLARHLAEKTRQAETYSQELIDQQGENQVLRRKHLQTVKELNRELQHLRKHQEVCEWSSGTLSLDHDSRASSCTSLNTVESSIPVQTNRPAQQSSSSPSNINLQTESVEPDKQTLIEHIVKLQKANAQKMEKVEFLEEHNQQLVSELQKKSRIIQNYIMREQSGMLTSATMDLNKAEFTKHKTIMSSLYNSKPVDGNMTLELSLEINNKLQAVLEDILLKNITLKENIDTLGSEIARITMQNKSKT